MGLLISQKQFDTRRYLGNSFVMGKGCGNSGRSWKCNPIFLSGGQSIAGLFVSSLDALATSFSQIELCAIGEAKKYSHETQNFAGKIFCGLQKYLFPHFWRHRPARTGFAGQVPRLKSNTNENGKNELFRWIREILPSVALGLIRRDDSERFSA